MKVNISNGIWQNETSQFYLCDPTLQAAFPLHLYQAILVTNLNMGQQETQF